MARLSHVVTRIGGGSAGRLCRRTLLLAGMVVVGQLALAAPGYAVQACQQVGNPDAPEPEWGPELADRPWTPFTWNQYLQPGSTHGLFIPQCRFMVHGTLDQNLGTRAAGITGWKNMNRYAQLTDGPNDNPNSGSYHGLRLNDKGLVRWALYDSYGQIIRYMYRPWNSSKTALVNYWEIQNAQGVTVDTTQTQAIDRALPTIEVQGRGCMYPQSLEDSYAMIGFKTSTKGTLTQKKVAIRAFIGRGALPSNGDVNGNALNIDQYDTGCGGASGSATTLNSMVMSAHDYTGYYVGSSDCDPGLGDPNIADCPVYSSYGTIESDWMPIAAQSTSVISGGIFRAVVKAGTGGVVGDSLHVTDCFGYSDPNIPGNGNYRGTQSSSVQWYYGRVYKGDGVNSRKPTDIYGWFPRPRTGVVSLSTSCTGT